MSYLNEQIMHVIRELANRPVIFSAADVAASANLKGMEHAIENALHTQCKLKTLIKVTKRRADATPYDCYLGIRPAKKWWQNHTLRLANAGLYCLTKAQLAGAMSLAFDAHKWNIVPLDLLEVGRRRAMVAEGYTPGTFVFPWAFILHTNPAGKASFRALIERMPAVGGCAELSHERMLDDVLSRLTQREVEVMRLRFGFNAGAKSTLQQVGNRYGVSRERIRQIQEKARRKLEGRWCQQRLWEIFMLDFLRSQGALLLPDFTPSPQRQLLFKSIGVRTTPIPKLNIRFIAPPARLTDYLTRLRGGDALSDEASEESMRAKFKALPFLSRRDGARIDAAEKAYLNEQNKKTHASMLCGALRSLGRAAHYAEIAAECNRLFPQRRNSTHNWHAALSRCAKYEKFGIVWTGTHGTYGLVEHGYSRPETNLHAAVAGIVAKKFTETREPVPVEVVVTELSQQRRELNLNSVKIALGLNDKLMSQPGGYIPKTAFDQSSEYQENRAKQYDIVAALAAFRQPNSD